jgi:formyltetrahydrofolate deformylase
MKNTAVLLIHCPDRKGLVARVAGLLYEHGANILHADQHQDHELGLFFMRVEWSLRDPGALDKNHGKIEAHKTGALAGGTTDGGALGESGGKAGSSKASEAAGEVRTGPALDESKAGFAGNGSDFDLDGFRMEFAKLASELEMRWRLTEGAHRPRVALYCSQYLHCMADLLHRWRTGELDCEIPLIVSNHRAVARLAEFYGVAFEHAAFTPGTRAEAEERQLGLLSRHGIELVVLARYMQILSPGFVERYPAAIINVHHSFLPAFTGARPYHAAHARGVKLIGATSHYVTEILDEGPIIEQDVARVSHRDQVEDLVAKGRDLERMVLSRAVRWHLERRILCYGNKTVVFD